MQGAGEQIVELVCARLAAGKPCVLVVRTGSMAPFLQPGDAVQVAPIRTWPPERRTVLVVRQGEYLVTHRLVDWVGIGTKEQMLLQGDACPRPDHPAAPSAVLGTVVARRRGGKWMTLRTQRWGGNCGLAWWFGVLRDWGLRVLGSWGSGPSPPEPQNHKTLKPQ